MKGKRGVAGLGDIWILFLVPVIICFSGAVAFFLASQILGVALMSFALIGALLLIFVLKNIILSSVF